MASINSSAAWFTFNLDLFWVALSTLCCHYSMCLPLFLVTEVCSSMNTHVLLQKFLLVSENSDSLYPQIHSTHFKRQGAHLLLKRDCFPPTFLTICCQELLTPGTTSQCLQTSRLLFHALSSLCCSRALLRSRVHFIVLSFLFGRIFHFIWTTLSSTWILQHAVQRESYFLHTIDKCPPQLGHPTILHIPV